MEISSSFRTSLTGLALAILVACTAQKASAQTVTYVHTDALGTPIAMTDASGNIIETSEYSPYGDLLSRPDSDGPGYTGHVQDAATGMAYMQQRYYDPQLGLFLSVDPIGGFLRARRWSTTARPQISS